MESLAKQIRETQVKAGSVAIFWLGQAGFAFKTPAGMIILTDPYLTDYVQRVAPQYGLKMKRLMPKLLEAQEVDADFVVNTHAHEDHLDVDALPQLVRNSRIHFFGAPDCQKLYEEAGIPRGRFTIFHAGEVHDLNGFSLTGVYADHGVLAPQALGVLFNFGGIKIWQVGDSAYRPDMWQGLFDQNIDVLVPPINGAYGNLNAIEAAKLARDAHAKVVIPCHFWMFAEHLGNPSEFIDACKQYAPGTRVVLLSQGELYAYHS